jgi:hypothetical protein
MKSRYRYAIIGVFTLVVGLVCLWITFMPSSVADFAPTHSPQEAARRVYAAQQIQETHLISNVIQGGPPNLLPKTTTVYFPQTGHHLSNKTGFLDFWRAHGQLQIFGYPITEQMEEDGRQVQYFERVRMEHHPELAGTEWEVQLGLLGTELMGGGPTPGIPNPANGLRYFPETQHTIYHEFDYFWERRGGIPIFGMPIGQEVAEDGRIIQYFERARFEYNPDDMPAFYRTQEQYHAFSLNTLYEVVLSDLGRQYAREHGIDTSPRPRKTGDPDWSHMLWKRRIEINLTKQWLYAYEDEVPVYDAPVTTGRNGFNTPAGNFAVYDKLTNQTMSGSAGGETWYVPNVPWVMYISGGVALHGTYWHNLFGSGNRLSHGCVNLPIDDAQWLYEWADVGTSVQVYY